MRFEVCLSTFDAELPAVLRAAETAEDAGVGGIWVMDHLAGPVHEGRRTVLECLTTLASVASVTDRCRLGSLVLNPVLRSPVIVAQSFASLAQLAPGRLWMGLGAGGGVGRYGDELAWAGFENTPAGDRRARLTDYLGAIDHLWSGSAGPWLGTHHGFAGSAGFLRPDPLPNRLIAGYGPRMATLAGRHGDEFNTFAGLDDLERVVATARSAGAATGRRDRLRISVFAVAEERWLDAGSPERRRLEEVEADVMIVVLPAPHDPGLIRAIGECQPTGASPEPGVGWADE